MFACCHYYFILPSSLISIHTTCISLSLRRTSAPIHLTSVLGVLGTQETSCILIAGLLERELHASSNVISMNALNPIVAHVMEKSKLGEASFYENDIFSSQL